MPFLIGAIIAAVLGAGGVAVGYVRSDTHRVRRAARRPHVEVRRAARRAHANVRPILRRLHTSSRAYADEERAARMRATPIEELRRYGARNVRWSALDEGGIETVGDLARRRGAGLVHLPGVGPVTAKRVARAARGLRQDLRGEPAEIPHVDAWSRKTVRELVGAARPVLEAREHLDRANRLGLETARTARRNEAVKQHTGLTDWLLRTNDGEARQRLESEVRAQVEHVERLRVAGLLEPSAPPRRPAGIPQRDLERDFRDRYADYAGVLEDALTREVPRVGADGLSRRGVHRGLPQEIARRVEAFPLDASGLGVTLRRYQQFGARYMLAQERTLLGDEMGLGKTIQALAAIVHIANEGKGRHFLVVCPASIIRNWSRELEARTSLPARLLFGDDRDEHRAAWLADGGVGMTSYATLRSMDLDADLRRHDIRIPLLVVDEAHYAKNPGAGRTRAVQEVIARADRIALMTGTPMENEPDEFTRLVAMVSPEIAANIDDHAGFNRLASTVAPVYLRRNQKDVLRELPERIEKEEWLDLDPADEEAYRAAVLDHNYMAMRRSVTIGDGGGGSAKLDHLDELLTEYRALGRKVLVFSFFLDVLDIIARRFDAVGTIQGRLSPDKRMELIDEFRGREGFAVLASQIQAGGVGLNMQSASVVVLMEPQWKPSTEEQAVARAHRMGQTEHVIVHRMLARQTVDGHMVERLAEKREAFDRTVRHSALKDASREATEAKFAEAVIEAEIERLTEKVEG